MTFALTLLTGPVALLQGTQAKSAIAKRPVAGRLWLGPEGFDGDAQADRRVHGGPEKAVHHYPLDHYQAWRVDLGDLPVLGAPGAFGENISGAGLTEETVAVGDIFQLGGALVQHDAIDLGMQHGNANFTTRSSPPRCSTRAVAST